MYMKSRSVSGYQRITTITPFSRWLSIFLFLIIPMLAFYMGMKYQQDIDTLISLESQASYYSNAQTYKETAPKKSIANPATVYCVKQGGKVTTVQNNKEEVTVCVFSDGSQCEQWSYYKGDCKPKSVK